MSRSGFLMARAAAAAVALAAPQFAKAHDASRFVEAPRATYNFNSGWKMSVGDSDGATDAGFDGTGWEIVTVPLPSATRGPSRRGFGTCRPDFRIPAGPSQKVFTAR